MSFLPIVEVASSAGVRQEPDEQAGGCACGGCGCGDMAGRPPAEAEAGVVQPGDLDVRLLEPARRHEQIGAAVACLQPGEGFVLANDHDPKRLRDRLQAAEPGQIEWAYLAQGPDVWRVEISRVAGHCC